MNNKSTASKRYIPLPIAVFHEKFDIPRHGEDYLPHTAIIILAYLCININKFTRCTSSNDIYIVNLDTIAADLNRSYGIVLRQMETLKFACLIRKHYVSRKTREWSISLNIHTLKKLGFRV